MSTQHDATTDGEQYETDHDAKTPVNQVYVSDSGRRFIIEECVQCGETHYHGAKDPTVASGGRSHRSSHCHDRHLDGGYYLELAGDADPPVHWREWASHDGGGDDQ